MRSSSGGYSSARAISRSPTGISRPSHTRSRTTCVNRCAPSKGSAKCFAASSARALRSRGGGFRKRVGPGGTRMPQLVNDLLHFSRFSREPLHCLRVPLRELVLQIVARLKEQLGEPHTSVRGA